MKNSLADLNNHLFAQMERLASEDLTGSDLQREIARTKAITSVSREIVGNARVLLDAKNLAFEYNKTVNLPQLTAQAKDDGC